MGAFEYNGGAFSRIDHRDRRWKGCVCAQCSGDNMALVVFRDQINNVEISKKMFPPKKVGNLEQWFRQACRTIREIPSDHSVINTQCSPKWITWELTSPKGERSYVVIDRSVPSIG